MSLDEGGAGQGGSALPANTGGSTENAGDRDASSGVSGSDSLRQEGGADSLGGAPSQGGRAGVLGGSPSFSAGGAFGGAGSGFAGDAESGGVGGYLQEGGSAGAAGDGGLAGAPSNPDDELQPVAYSCGTHKDGIDALTPGFSGDVAAYISVDPAVQQVTVFATVLPDQLVGVRWNYDSTGWGNGWSCFNNVPKPARLAGLPASNRTQEVSNGTQEVSNGTQEVFVSTMQGSLFSRRMTDVGWSQWNLAARPSSTARVRDIAAWRPHEQAGAVLVATSEGLFLERTDGLDESQANRYTPWALVTEGSFERVALCGVATLRAFAVANGQLFTIDLEGGNASPVLAEKTSGLVDIDCAENASSALSVYGIGREGDLFRLGFSAANELTRSVTLQDAAGQSRLTSIAAVPRRDFGHYVFVTDELGSISFSPDSGATLYGSNWPVQ